MVLGNTAVGTVVLRGVDREQHRACRAPEPPPPRTGRGDVGLRASTQPCPPTGLLGCFLGPKELRFAKQGTAFVSPTPSMPIQLLRRNGRYPDPHLCESVSRLSVSPSMCLSVTSTVSLSLICVSVIYQSHLSSIITCLPTYYRSVYLSPTYQSHLSVIILL